MLILQSELSLLGVAFMKSESIALGPVDMSRPTTIPSTPQWNGVVPTHGYGSVNPVWNEFFVNEVSKWVRLFTHYLFIYSFSENSVSNSTPLEATR